MDWSIGPGARIGLVGVNGTGKTSVLRLLTGELAPVAGTRQARHHAQDRASQPGAGRGRRRRPRARRGRKPPPDHANWRAAGRSAPTTLLEDFGFTGDKLTARIADLSGGERRRLQFLRLLLDEPNVLLLDEPTNDLDIDTLTVIEDYLDGWPGTLIVVTHDRYFLERVTDVTYALTGGRPLRSAARRHRAVPRRPGGRTIGRAVARRTAAGASRRQRANGAREKSWHASRASSASSTSGSPSCTSPMAEAAADHVRLGELNAELQDLHARKESLEEAWLAAADD